MATEFVPFGRPESSGAPGLLAEPVEESRIGGPFKGFPDTEFANEAREDALAAAFKAIGHPVRLQILEILSCQSDPMCVCHIESRFTLSQPTISHHLRLLRKAGLVNSERRGTWIYYSVRREGVGPLYTFMNSIVCD
ncbi:MAG: helix-turn-helix transcriptional regulator [Caldilineaceae bacterium SB0670_bin_27]|uniref:Helix-turn-helix transcriptional regulator n=1 Tax=Caldilineaceae bacterium SB0664_bin_27 TaxID=2605260 RepID=A0A6B0YNA7_9CHLR|nr:helix-turn-helix transcriptional regulator [Caldilineaceae bacterium SB0664_bin_27]MYJ78666.1 helix-turn-helix transcriptional regulator [Caldilineaceae bacterium SB0670_bin_27]